MIPRVSKVPNLNVKPEDVTLDDVIQTADNAMQWFVFYAANTFPMVASIEAAQDYFSALDGVAYTIPEGIQIMAPPPIPGMMEGMPTLVPVELSAEGHTVDFAWRSQGNAYTFEIEKRVQGKSRFMVKIAHVPDEQQFGIMITYARKDFQPQMRMLVQEGINPKTQHGIREYVNEARENRMGVHEMTPYEALQWIHLATAHVFYDRRLAEMDAEIGARRLERQSPTSASRRPN